MDHFCYEFELETGAYVIGIIDITIGIVGVIELPYIIRSGDVPYGEESKKTAVFRDHTQPTQAVDVILAAVLILLALSAVVLIVGAWDGRPLFLVPWMIMNGVSIVALILHTILGLVYYKIPPITILRLFIYIIIIIKIYFELVIWGLYEALMDEDFYNVQRTVE